MKKRKIFIVLSIITLILFFAVAATCNFCGVPIDVGETDETEEEAKEDSGGKSTSATTASQGGSGTTDADEPPADEPSADEPPADEPPADEPSADEPIGEGGGSATVYTLDLDKKLCGYVTEDGSVHERTIFIGDTASDQAAKAYLSFDIGDLPAGPYIDASLSITGIAAAVDPTFADQLIIKVFDYGDVLTSGAFAEGGDHLAAFSTAGLTSINVSSDNLKTLIERKKSEGKNYFQLKFGLDDYSDNDGTADLFAFPLDNAVLRVTK